MCEVSDCRQDKTVALIKSLQRTIYRLQSKSHNKFINISINFHIIIHPGRPGVSHTTFIALILVVIYYIQYPI